MFFTLSDKSMTPMHIGNALLVFFFLLIKKDWFSSFSKGALMFYSLSVLYRADKLYLNNPNKMQMRLLDDVRVNINMHTSLSSVLHHTTLSRYQSKVKLYLVYYITLFKIWIYYWSSVKTVSIIFLFLNMKCKLFIV